MNTSVFFQGGTLVLHHSDDIEHIPVPFQFVKDRWRCVAYRYHAVLPWLRECGIRNDIPRWPRLALELHEYQVQALDAWKQANGRGSIVLPTGAGKTLAATHAIRHVNSSTVVLVPATSLVYQWYALLTNVFQTEIGVDYGGEKRVPSNHDDLSLCRGSHCRVRQYLQTIHLRLLPCNLLSTAWNFL